MLLRDALNQTFNPLLIGELLHMTLHVTKRVSILLSTIALTALLPGISLAQTHSSSTMSGSSSTTMMQKPGSDLANQLQLTPDQKNKIRGIRASRTRKINGVLTSAQRTQLQQDLKSGKKLSQSLQDLNLNADQKQKILAIVRQSNQDIIGTLKPDQKAKLTAYLRQRHQSQTQTPIE